MIRRDIERFEVVEVVLDLGSVRDLESEPREDLLHALEGAGDGVQPTPAAAPARQGDVDPIGGEALFERALVEGAAPLGDARLQVLLGLVHGTTEVAALGRGAARRPA